MTEFEQKLQNDLTAELDKGNRDVLQSVLRAEKLAPKTRRGRVWLRRLAVPIAFVLVAAIWALPILSPKGTGVYLSEAPVSYSYDATVFAAGMSDGLREAIAPMSKTVTSSSAEDLESLYFVSAVCPYSLKNSFIANALSKEAQPIIIDGKKVAIGFTAFLTAEQIEKYADVFYFALA